MTVLILRRFYFFVNRRKPTKKRKRIYTNLYYTILFYTGLPVWQPNDSQTDYQVTVKLDTIGIPSDYQKTKTLYRRKIDFFMYECIKKYTP